MTSAKLGVLVAIALVCALGACQSQRGDQPGQPQSQVAEPGGASAQPDKEATTSQSSTAEPAASAAQEGAQTTSAAKRSPEQIVADFLQCKREDLTLTSGDRLARRRVSRSRTADEKAFAFEIGASAQQRESGLVTVDVKRGYVTDITLLSRLSGEAVQKASPELDARCKELATAWLRRVCPLDRDRLVAGKPVLAGQTLYTIMWEESADNPQVRTGSRVTLSFDMAKGQLVSYMLRVAPTKVPKPKLGEAEARRAAEAVARKLGEQYSVG
ncbi:hypothetical protein LLH03_03310, partial [bacterium]|nr:hypothetical protein [bacterium]